MITKSIMYTNNCVLLLLVSLLNPVFSSRKIETTNLSSYKSVRLRKDHFYKQLSNWLNNILVFEYQKSLSDKSMSPKGVKFIKDVLAYKYKQRSDVDIYKLKLIGKDLLKINKNPFIRFCYSALLSEIGLYKASIKNYHSCHNDLLNKSYINKDIFNFLLSINMLKTSHKARPVDYNFVYKWKRKCFNSLVKIFRKGVFNKSNVRIGYYYANHLFTSYYSRPQWIYFNRRIKRTSNLDKWLKNMIAGEAEIRIAWRKRGSGYASTVTKRGWIGFKKHLKNACRYLTEAYKIYPEYPESATKMITVALGGYANPGDTTRLWFDRAVKAEFDYMKAYDEYIYTLFPRWGGSKDKMQKFAKECLLTKRYDTDVPLLYLTTLRRISTHTSKNRWRMIFRQQNVYDNLLILYKNLQREPSRKEEINMIQMQRIVTTAWCGHYRQAKLLFDKLDKKPSLNMGFIKHYISYRGRNYTEIEAELELFNGPFSAIAIKAEHLHHSLNDESAEKLFLNLMEKYRLRNKNIYNYIRRRIGYMRLNRKGYNFVYFNSPLHMACHFNNLKLAKWLIENGANINEQNYKYETPLLYSIRLRRSKMALFLIEKGADINSGKNTMFGELQYSLFFRQKKVFDALIDNGADIHAPNRWGNFPLANAATCNFAYAAERLIKKGAKINAQNKRGSTALHTAAHYSYSAAKLLLDNNADLNIKNNKGETPYDIAKKYRKDKIIKLFEKYQKDKKKK